MVTTELRRDIVTGRWVVVDLTPQKRRSDFDLEPVAVAAAAGSCAFCEGNESAAGSEILAWRDGTPANTGGWSVRVVPNRLPLLGIEAGGDIRTDGLHESRDGLGAHEVVIESPRHDESLQSMSVDAVWRVLWAWRTRMQDLKRDARFASVVAFKNHGRAAGARMDHAHSQVVAYPFVPSALDEEVRGSAAYHDRTGQCVFCDLAAQDLRERRRVVSETAELVAITPYASRVPFEVWLLPLGHAARFEDALDGSLRAMAQMLKIVLARIDWALERPAYNLVLHSAPFDGSSDRSFHWHLEVLPRVTRVGGLEWGSGVTRNPVSPEEAAAALRKP